MLQILLSSYYCMLLAATLIPFATYHCKLEVSDLQPLANMLATNALKTKS